MYSRLEGVLIMKELRYAPTVRRRALRPMALRKNADYAAQPLTRFIRSQCNGQLRAQLA